MNKVVLITGAAKRVGAVIARFLHAQGVNVVIHYRSSEAAARALCEELNQQRKNSAHLVQADLANYERLPNLIEQSLQAWNRLDALINNASDFFPTPIGQVDNLQWEKLFSSNLKGPFFLSQAAVSALKEHRGTIINITDIHAQKPLKNYSVYCMAKAGLVMMTQSLAKELAPHIRVNAVAPGAIMWPTEDNSLNEKLKTDITSRIALRRLGDPLDIAKAILFLIENADYVTGQILAIDGGRLLNC